MAQESISDFMEIARDYAKAEKELDVQHWVYIGIERIDANGNRVRIFSYDLPREVYERRNWVVRWRIARLQCQYPKQYVECFHSYYDRRSGEILGFESCLSKLISAKAQVTKAERTMLDYIDRNRQHNLFFDEATDEDLVKFRDKLERKKAHVTECEKRLEQLVERRRKGL